MERRGRGERGAACAAVWAFALAFGWTEGATVVYLRDIYLRTGNSVATYPFGLSGLPVHLIAVEVVREACTLVLLGAIGWLAGRRWRDRLGAFVLAFGIWDVVYYVVLRAVAGWPADLATWDVLFLIPVPWVGPVWAPVTVALFFAVAGSYLFWTPDRPRDYRWTDGVILLASPLVIVLSFLAEWTAVLEGQPPQQFPAWLFWSGVALGVAWFVRVERRAPGPGSALHAHDRLEARDLSR
jgi:hypothetical protein